jgi:hypothetical protein
MLTLFFCSQNTEIYYNLSLNFNSHSFYKTKFWLYAKPVYLWFCCVVLGLYVLSGGRLLAKLFNKIPIISINISTCNSESYLSTYGWGRLYAKLKSNMRFCCVVLGHCALIYIYTRHSQTLQDIVHTQTTHIRITNTHSLSHLHHWFVFLGTLKIIVECNHDRFSFDKYASFWINQ